MPKIINSLLFIFLFFIVGATPNATNVSGTITSNTTWTLANSPYNVTGNVTLASGVTLTISPGVSVLVSGNSSIDASAGILFAQGNYSAPIVFSAYNDFYNVFNTLKLSSGSQLDFCVINKASTGITIQSASPNIQHSIIKNCNMGFLLINNSSPTITYSLITNNTYGIWLDQPQPNGTPNPTIQNNSIFNNANYNFYTSGASSIGTQIINVANNWWGTTNINDIESTISDHADVSTKPTIVITPILSSGNGLLTNVNVSSQFTTIPNTTSINYTLNTNAAVTIKVFSSGIYRTLEDSTVKSAGSYSETFDGKDSSGQYYPEYPLIFTIQAISTNGVAIYEPQFIPGAVNASVSSFTPSFNMYRGETCNIDYNLSASADVNFTVAFDYYSGYGESFAIGPRPAGNNTETWNGFDSWGFTGPFDLFIEANLLPENAIVFNKPQELSNYTVDPYAFRPIYGDITQISYTLSNPATISISLVDQYLTSYGYLFQNQQESAGTHTLIWDGKFGQNILPTGVYILSIDALSNGLDYGDSKLIYILN